MVGAVAALGAVWLWWRSDLAPTRSRARALGSSRSRIPARVDAVLAPYVAQVAPDRRVGQVLGWWGILGALSLLIGTVLGPVGMALAVVGVLAAGPAALLRAKSRAAADRRRALPEFVHAVARSLRSGTGLVTALATVAVPRPLAREVAALRTRITDGGAVVDALAAWADARPDPGTRAVAGAFAVVHLEGGRGAAPLEGLADALAARESVVREAGALATQARLSAIVILVAPIAFVLVGGVAAPDQLAHLTGSWAGRICLGLGLGLDALGGWWMHRIVAVVA